MEVYVIITELAISLVITGLGSLVPGARRERLVHTDALPVN